jgi:hypothetical protein
VVSVGVTVEWSQEWEAPRSVMVEADEDMLGLLDEVHRGAVARGLPTAAVITRGESALIVVLGIDAIAYLQWMGGVNGSYLSVDVGDRTGSGDLIGFSFQGHYSEIPSGEFVGRDEALDEVRHFASSGGLSQRWLWSGWLQDDADPGRDVRVVAPR